MELIAARRSGSPDDIRRSRRKLHRTLKSKGKLYWAEQADRAIGSQGWLKVLKKFEKAGRVTMAPPPLSRA